MTTESPSCYHCGLPIPGGVHIQVVIETEARAMCCAGCQAVAEAIVANGLEEYYRHRDALPESPREALPLSLKEAGVFDLAEVQQGFVHEVHDASGRLLPHEREAALILEGITCSACVWLNESHLARQPGVTLVDINYATRRARVRWDERVTQLSRLLTAIAAIGYRAHPYDPALSEQLSQQERRSALWRLFVAGFGMMQVMMYAVPVYLAADGDMMADIEQLMRWASLILTLPVILYSAAPFFRNAWRDLGRRRLGMDFPVALGLGCAFVASLWATLTQGGEVYFDSVTMFVFFLLLGRYFEMMARQRAARGVESLARALPALAARLPAYPSWEAEAVTVAQLVVDDHVLIRPGERVPADGVVVDGASEVDESLLSGESRPLSRRLGDLLVGGSINVSSPLVMRITRVGEATRLAAIRRLVERAAEDKPHLVELADRIARHFVVALVVLACATAALWWWLEPARALWVFVAVLVVSCPCALSLATPAALTVATGAFARLGVLVTRGHAIETLARVDHFVLDKTGTLTEGRLSLAQILPLGGQDQAAVLRLAASLEQGSEHPLGRALCLAAAGNAVAATSVELPVLTQLQSHTGQGVSACSNGRMLRIGRLEFVAEGHAQALPDEALQWCGSAMRRGDTVVALADDTAWLALFSLQDSLRPQAGSVVAGLQAMGMRVSLLSGDAPETVAAVARQLGLPADAARGGCSPEEKYAYLRQCQAVGEVVAMVGDGVNDAPVLAQAQVSVAMGSGADLARQAADVVLLGERLTALLAGVHLARRCLRVVRQNLWWAFGYNISAIPLAMTGIITPWMAGIGMSLSSLLVVLNALRLQRVSDLMDRE